MLKRWLEEDKKMIGTMVVGPIVAMLMVCFISSAIYIEHLPVAIANLDDSSLSRTIVSEFEDHPGFETALYVDSEEELREAVYTKKAVAGLLIPNGYGKDVSSMKAPRALFLLDGTNSSASGAAQGYAASIFATLNAGIKIQALQKGGVSDNAVSQMMGGFTFTARDMYDPHGSFMYNLLYMVIPYMVQMQFLCFYLFPLLWKEREKGTLSRNNRFLIQRVALMFALICVSTYLALLLGSLIFRVPVNPNFLCHFMLMFSYLFALSGITFLISLLTSSRAKHYIFELFCIIGVLIMLTSGMVWPVFATPGWFTTLVRVIWPFAMVVMPFKSFHLKGTGWIEAFPVTGELILFGIFWIVVGALIMWVQKSREDKLQEKRLDN